MRRIIAGTKHQWDKFRLLRRKVKMTGLSYGDNTLYAIGEDALPQAVLWKLAQRTYSHIMGNEAASALKSKTDNGGLPEGQTEEQFLHTWRVAKRQQVIDGTVGLRSGGPRIDPLEKEMRDLVVKRLRASAVKHTPKGEKTVFPTKMDGTYTFADGSSMTLSEMVAAYTKNHLDEVKAEAQRIIRERARAAKVA